MPSLHRQAVLIACSGRGSYVVQRVVRCIHAGHLGAPPTHAGLWLLTAHHGISVQCGRYVPPSCSAVFRVPAGRYDLQQGK